MSSDWVLSSASKRFCDCVFPAGTAYIDCRSPNLIYLIICNKCYVQYVCETAQKANERFNENRTGFKHPYIYEIHKTISCHFDEGNCRVKKLEKLEGYVRTPRNSLGASCTSFRKERESRGY